MSNSTTTPPDEIDDYFEDDPHLDFPDCEICVDILYDSVTKRTKYEVYSKRVNGNRISPVMICCPQCNRASFGFQDLIDERIRNNNPTSN